MKISSHEKNPLYGNLFCDAGISCPSSGATKIGRHIENWAFLSVEARSKLSKIEKVEEYEKEFSTCNLGNGLASCLDIDISAGKASDYATMELVHCCVLQKICTL